MYFQLQRVFLRDVWGFYWSLQFSLLLLLFQNLYQLILALLWQSSNSECLQKHNTININLIFREFIFNFDVSCVSRKFTAYQCLHVSKKWLLMQFILSVVLERMLRFLTTVDLVLEGYNNCLPNSKWLGVFNCFCFDAVSLLTNVP